MRETRVRRHGAEVPVQAPPSSTTALTTTSSPTRSTPFTVYLIRDRTANLVTMLRKNGGILLHHMGWSAYRTRRSLQATRLLNSIEDNKPDILWLHLSGGHHGHTDSPMFRIANAQVAPPVHAQLQSRRRLIMEGTWSEVHWQRTLNQTVRPGTTPSLVHWCALGAVCQDQRPLHAVHAAYASPPLPATPCSCGKSGSTRYGADMGAGFEKFAGWAREHLGMTTQAVACNATTRAGRNTAEAAQSQTTTTLRTPRCSPPIRRGGEDIKANANAIVYIYIPNITTTTNVTTDFNKISRRITDSTSRGTWTTRRGRDHRRGFTNHDLPHTNYNKYFHRTRSRQSQQQRPRQQCY